MSGVATVETSAAQNLVAAVSPLPVTIAGGQMTAPMPPNNDVGLSVGSVSCWDRGQNSTQAVALFDIETRCRTLGGVVVGYSLRLQA